jgi:S-methylmethionine-dependent homocysteine/selenocysteine methylase
MAFGVKATINADGVHFVQGLRARHGGGRANIKVGGLVGCRNDGYRSREGLSSYVSLAERPLGYMVNCSYPTFLRAAEQPPALFERLIGYQANASALDHRALDGAKALHAEDIAQWGPGNAGAQQDLWCPNVRGGCCGIGVKRLRYIVESCTASV